jgi:hypothetical protein
MSFPTFRKDRKTLIFKGEAEVECLKLEDEGTVVFRYVGTARAPTWRHIAEQLNPHQYQCDNLKFRSSH